MSLIIQIDLQTVQDAQKLNCNSKPRKKFELENLLQTSIQQIEQEKKVDLSIRNSIGFTRRPLMKEARDNPAATAAKASLVIFSIICLHPTFIGSIACLNEYRLENYNDIYSSDLTIATTATQLFTNTGQGITFLLQNMQFVYYTSKWLLNDAYESGKFAAIESIYHKCIQQLSSEEEKEYIRGLLKHEFLLGKASPEKLRIKFKTTMDLEGMSKEIEEEKRRRYSMRNLACLTLRAFLPETKKAPVATCVKTSLIALAGLSLHPLMLGAIACLNTYRIVDSKDLYSPDLAKANSATQTDANTGHFVEYTVAAALLAGISIKNLFNNSYQKVLREEINAIYDKYIKDECLNTKESDYFYKLKQIELARHGFLITDSA